MIKNSFLDFALDYYQGAVYIYRPRNQYQWTNTQILLPPTEPLDGKTGRTILNSQMNFGISVDIDEDSNVIVVGANAYCITLYHNCITLFDVTPLPLS